MKLNIICSYICFQERTPVHGCVLFGSPDILLHGQWMREVNQASNVLQLEIQADKLVHQ